MIKFRIIWDLLETQIWEHEICNLPVFLLVFLQSYMDSEIRAIMAQYMPLDSQGEVVNHVHEERAWIVSLFGYCVWSLGVAYPVYPFEFRFWAFEFDRLCIIWTIKGSELDSYPTLFIGDVANCILNLGQTFLSYFISLDSRISVHVTSWVPHLWL